MSKAKRIAEWRLPRYTVESVVSSLAQVVDWGVSLLGVPQVHVRTKGKGVRVAVLDTGAPDHPDVAGAVVAMRDFTRSRFGARDVQGHGSHVSGIVAARDNEAGVLGVAPESEIVSAKVLGDNGTGSSAGIAAGVRWALEQGAKVLNLSLGSSQGDEVMHAPLREAVEAGAIVVCAAGNSGSGVEYPGRWPNIVTVAAMDESRRIASFSCRGPEVEVAAPGVNVVSTYLNGQLAKLSGTCLAKGSYVYGPAGPKRIEEVQVGDVVFAFKGGQVVERVVYANHYRGRAEVHQIRAGGRDVLATATHKMLVLDEKARDLDWVPVGSLKPQHRLLLPREMPTRVNPYLDAMLTEDFCFLLGFFAGDGWLTSTTHGRRVNFASGDSPGIMGIVTGIYEREFGKQMRQAKNGGWHYDDSTKAAMIVEALGLNAPAKEKTIPLWVWTLPKAKQIAFYKGYRTADGHVYKHPEYRCLPDSFECASGDLVRRLAALADYHGWEHSTVSSRERLLRAPSSKEQTLTTSHTLKVIRAKPAGGFSYIRRKSGTDPAQGEQVARDMGLNTESLWASSWRLDEGKGTTDVYDLTVPDADCFVTQGLITHNSMSAPFCSGVAALWLAAGGTGGQRAFLDWLKETCVDVGKPGRDAASGWGVITPEKLLAAEAPGEGVVFGPDDYTHQGWAKVQQLARMPA